MSARPNTMSGQFRTKRPLRNWLPFQCCAFATVVLFGIHPACSATTEKPQMAMSGRDALSGYEVSGVITREGPTRQTNGGLAQEQFTSGFVVAVKGSCWHLGLYPSNWPARYSRAMVDNRRVPRLISSEMSCDGTTVFQVSRFAPEDQASSAPSQVAEQFAGAKPSDRGSQWEFHPLWYAFASGEYCSSVTNTKFLALQPRVGIVSGTLRRFPQPHGLPEWILATNAEATMKWEFSAKAFTNVNGISIPTQGTLDCWFLGDNPERSYGMNLRVVAVTSYAGRTNFNLSLKEELSLVQDSTYRSKDGRLLFSKVTNQWPAPKEVESVHKAYLKETALPKQEGTATRTWIVRAVLAFVAGCPLLVLFSKKVMQLKKPSGESHYENNHHSQ